MYCGNLYDSFFCLAIETGTVKKQEFLRNNLSLLKHFVKIVELDYESNFKKIHKLLVNHHNLKETPSIDQILIIFNILYSKNKKIKKWNGKLKSNLIWVVSVFEIIFTKEFTAFNDIEWNIIASFFPFETEKSIKYLWYLMVTNSKENFWTADEDEILKEIIIFNNEKIDWSFVSRQFFNKSNIFKNKKQCFERWNNHLNPMIKKKNWSIQEDILLLSLCLKNGKKWSEIANNFVGRNQHSLKNRFYSIMGHELKMTKKMVHKTFKKSLCPYLIYQVILILKQDSEKEEKLIQKNNDFTVDDFFLSSDSSFCSSKLVFD